MNTIYFRETYETATEAETLQKILSFGTRANTTFVVQNLLETFGSLKNVIEARPEQLKSVNGMTDKMTDALSAILPLFRIYQRELMRNKESIHNSREAESFCKSLLSGLRNEQFYVICLNAKCEIIGYRMISEGSISECSAYPRIVVETALNYNAHTVIFTHNHPGGTCAASFEDVKSTEQLQDVLKQLGIMVLDHIIVANNSTYSMVQHGDIDFYPRKRK